jgi:hypothetical protein
MNNTSDQPRKVVVQDFTSKEKSDIRTLMRFVEIYCREKHNEGKSQFTFKAFDIKDLSVNNTNLPPTDNCRGKTSRYALNAQNS